MESNWRDYINEFESRWINKGRQMNRDSKQWQIPIISLSVYKKSLIWRFIDGDFECYSLWQIGLDTIKVKYLFQNDEGVGKQK